MHIPLIFFGGFLVLVGLVLGIREIRNPIRLTGVVRRTRRRLVGATLLCLLGGLISQGPLPQAPVPREVLKHNATYWAGVLFLTFGLAGLAIWDTVDGVRALNKQLEVAENSELKHIQTRLEQS